MNTETTSGAAEAALDLLADREHSRAELHRKLLTRGFSADEISLILSRLVSQGLQSDQRYAERYIAQRSHRGYGPLRIRAELLARGVSSEIVGALLDEFDARWAARLKSLAQGRFGEMNSGDQRELARRARFLERRGFASAAIRQYLYD